MDADAPSGYRDSTIIFTISSCNLSLCYLASQNYQFLPLQRLLTKVIFVSLKIVGEDRNLCFSLVFSFAFVCICIFICLFSSFLFETLALKSTMSNVTFPNLIRISE